MIRTALFVEKSDMAQAVTLCAKVDPRFSSPALVGEAEENARLDAGAKLDLKPHTIAEIR
jgi:hypothetical protein